MLTVIAIVAALAVVWFARRIGSLAWAWAMGLLLAGILGNLTDRLFRDPGPFHGHVVDMLMLPNWPVFNFADVSINIAAGLIILLAFRGVRLDGTREGEEASTAPDEPGEPDEPDEPGTSDKPGKPDKPGKREGTP